MRVSQLKTVATAVIAKLDGPAAAAFGRLLAEYVRLEESPVQGAFLHQLVEPTLELLSRPSQADQAAEQPNGRKPAGAYLEWLKVVDRLIRQHGGAPSFEELAVEYEGQITVTKLNVDENRETAARFGIRSIPTILLFKDGSQVEQIIGALPKSTIKAKVQQRL